MIKWNNGKVFHILLRPHPYSYIYPHFCLGQISDHHRYPLQDWVVYEEEPKPGYYDIEQIFSSDYNIKNPPSQAIYRETLTI